MARTESRTRVSIWSNEEFRDLTRDAQRVYWLLYSQPNINLCGVLAYTPGRWARYAADDGAEGIRTAVNELATHRFVLVDQDTEEIFVRSFMRNDGVWRSPKTRGAARGQVSTVMSKSLRDAIECEMARLEDEDPDTRPDGVPDTESHGEADGEADGTRAHAHAVSSLQSPSPVSSLRDGDRSSPAIEEPDSDDFHSSRLEELVSQQKPNYGEAF
jgi:hypothetical protein